MLRRLATGLAAIFTFSRRAAPLIGPAKVIDGDTIVVAGELIRLHGIDAPELDQTFLWRGEPVACGTMSLAALEALIAGVKLRCEETGMIAEDLSPKGSTPVAGWVTSMIALRIAAVLV